MLLPPVSIESSKVGLLDYLPFHYAKQRIGGLVLPSQGPTILNGKMLYMLRLELIRIPQPAKLMRSMKHILKNIYLFII